LLKFRIRNSGFKKINSKLFYNTKLSILVAIIGRQKLYDLNVKKDVYF